MKQEIQNQIKTQNIKLKWRTKNKYEDIDTGKKIRKKDLRRYKTIIITKKTTINYEEECGTIERTHKLRDRRQLELPFNNT